MKIWKESYPKYLWGAVVGAVLTCIVGFTLGDWSTASSTKKMVAAAENRVLAKVCAGQATTDPAAIALLATKQPRDYDDVARDMVKVWKPVGYAYPINDYNFNRDCGHAIEALLKAKTASK